MRKTIIATLAAFVVIASLFLLERSLRLNRPIPTELPVTGDEKQKWQNMPIVPPTKRPEDRYKLAGAPTLINIITKEEVTLEQYRGKVLLINFWASWCDACIAEMPSIVKLYNLLKQDGFEVISVNLDETPEKVVPKLITKLSMNFPVYKDKGENFLRLFEVVAIPYSAVGVVREETFETKWAESGERDWASEKVITEIRKLMVQSKEG